MKRESLNRFIKAFHRGKKKLIIIELVIVFAFLGMLATIVLPDLIGFLTTGEVVAANTEVANTELAALAYYADNDGVSFPTNSAALVIGGYLSSDTIYGTYTFDRFGKVSAVVEKAAADNIMWDGTKWVKEWSSEKIKNNLLIREPLRGLPSFLSKEVVCKQLY